MLHQTRKMAAAALAAVALATMLSGGATAAVRNHGAYSLPLPDTQGAVLEILGQQVSTAGRTDQVVRLAWDNLADVQANGGLVLEKTGYSCPGTDMKVSIAAEALGAADAYVSVLYSFTEWTFDSTTGQFEPTEGSMGDTLVDNDGAAAQDQLIELVKICTQ